MNVNRTIPLIAGVLLFLTALGETTLAADPVILSRGQTIYASAYSYVLMGSGRHKFRVTSTLVVRNTSLADTITLTSVEYRDSEGQHLHHYLEGPALIGPLASREFIVEESDTSGGHSPSFILRWESDKVVNAPIVETLMIGGASTQGISFVGRAWVIEEVADPEDPEEAR